MSAGTATDRLPPHLERAFCLDELALERRHPDGLAHALVQQCSKGLLALRGLGSIECTGLAASWSDKIGHVDLEAHEELTRARNADLRQHTNEPRNLFPLRHDVL